MREPARGCGGAIARRTLSASSLHTERLDSQLRLRSNRPESPIRSPAVKVRAARRFRASHPFLIRRFGPYSSGIKLLGCAWAHFFVSGDGRCRRRCCAGAKLCRGVHTVSVNLSQHLRCSDRGPLTMQNQPFPLRLHPGLPQRAYTPCEVRTSETGQ